MSFWFFIMKFILGTKLEMSQRFKDGAVVPVTLIFAKPIVVTQVKTTTNDGYDAAQVGISPKRHLNKPASGHLKGLPPFSHLKEFRLKDPEKAPKKRDVIDVRIFTPGEKVTVEGVSKGRGFQGVMKRHHFHGQDASHGTKHAHREPGSIGGGGRHGRGRVVKGMRMAGRMGGDKVTIKNLEIMEVDAEKNILALKGAVPGAHGSLVLIKSAAEDAWK